MILQTTGPKGLLYKLIERAIIESHAENDYSFNVLNTKKVKQEYREAIKKSYDITEVDDNDILICFQEMTAAQEPSQEEAPAQDQNQEQTQDQEPAEQPAEEPAQEEQPADDNSQQAPEEAPEQEPEQNDQGTEDTEKAPAEGNGEEDEDKKEEQELKEAILKAMNEDDEQPQEPEKLDDATSQENKEAEEQGTTAQSSSNRETLIKAVSRALYIENKDDVETFDVDFNGKKTFFIKVKIRK